MKILTTILFLAIISLTQTPLGQILKIPVLIEHFYKHNKQDGISLLEFLDDHYSSDHNDSDQTEDKQLPFKSIILQTVGSAIIPGIIKPDFSLEFMIHAKVKLNDVFTSQQHLCSIFHPPRV